MQDHRDPRDQPATEAPRHSRRERAEQGSPRQSRARTTDRRAPGPPNAAGSRKPVRSGLDALTLCARTRERRRRPETASQRIAGAYRRERTPRFEDCKMDCKVAMHRLEAVSGRLSRRDRAGAAFAASALGRQVFTRASRTSSRDAPAGGERPSRAGSRERHHELRSDAQRRRRRSWQSSAVLRSAFGRSDTSRSGTRS